MTADILRPYQAHVTRWHHTFENAANYVEYPQDDIHVALSMTSPDLSISGHIVN